MNPSRLRLLVVTVIWVSLAACGARSVSDPIESARKRITDRDFAAAVVDLKSALQAAPNSGEARFLLGVALLEQGEVEAALLELGKSNDLGFDEELLAPKMARALLAAGKNNQVVRSYASMKLKSNQGQAELSTAVAVAQARLEQVAAAEATLAEAFDADPRFPWTLLTKARFEAAHGRFDEALKLAERSHVQGAANGEALLLQGTVLRFGKNDLDGAVKAFQQSALDPLTLIPARAALIQIALIRQNVTEAKAQLAELQKSRPKSADTLYLSAMVAYADKNYAQAESIVDQLLRVAPDNTKLLMLGGAASLQRGNLIAAETRLGKVVQTVEKAPFGRKMLADTYMRMGQPDKALNSLRPLLEQRPADGDALMLAGQAHLQAGNAQEAEAAFMAALKVRPDDFRLKTALALADLVRGNVDSAFDALQSIAARDTGDTADLALISALLRRREFGPAIDAITRFEKKFPTRPTASHLRGMALTGKGDLAGARAAYEAALRIDPGHFSSVASLAALDVREQRLDEARRRLDAEIKSSPRNIAARMAALEVMRRQGAKPAEMLAAIDEAIKADPTDSAPHLAKIAHMARGNDVKAAASAAQNALAALPNNAEVLDAAGRAFGASGDDQQAISTFNKLASVAPGSPLPFLRIAEVYDRRGDREASASSLSRAFEVAPLASEVHRRLLDRAAGTKDFRAVISAAKSLQKKYPAAAAGYLLEGDLETVRKAWPAALTAYRAALSKSGSGALPQRAVYATLVKSGDRTGAERFAADWLKTHPKDADLREHLGGEAILRKEYAVAERHFQQVVELKPRNGAAVNNLAWLMAELGRPGAVAMAERALELAPTAAPVLDTLAKAFASEGKFDRAIEAQKRSMEWMPERHEYRLNLARLYVRTGRQADAERELDTLSKLGDKFSYQDEVARVRSQLVAAPR